MIIVHVLLGTMALGTKRSAIRNSGSLPPAVSLYLVSAMAMFSEEKTQWPDPLERARENAVGVYAAGL